MTSTSTTGEHENTSPEVASISRYFHAMEQRVKALEAQVASLSGLTYRQSETRSDMSPVPRNKTSTRAVLETLSMDRGSFNQPDSNDQPIHAIELLVDDSTVKKIRIRSQQLVKIFQEVMNLELAPDTSKSIVMIQPYKALMVYQDRLEEKLSSLESATSLGAPDTLRKENELKAYLNLMVKVFNHDLIKDVTTYSDLRERIVETVSFSHLWYLFQPGDIVIEKTGTSTQAYRIWNVRGSTVRNLENVTDSRTKQLDNVFVLDCFSLGCDGKVFGPVQKVYDIMHFIGSTRVFSLPIVPAEYLRDQIGLSQLVQRGTQFQLLQEPSLRSYRGGSLDQVTELIDGQVMVDIELYYRQNPDMAPAIGLGEHVTCRDEEDPNSDIFDDRKVDKYLTEIFWKQNPEILETTPCSQAGKKTPLPSSQLMLLPSLMWAFYLRGRKWHALDVQLMSEIFWPQNAFDYLVLPAGHKEILASLVKAHGTKGSRIEEHISNVDLVVEKSKGLVLLFHGGPGVGKTSTAECLAAHIERPLLPITAADIGVTAADAERYLETFFALAQRWRAILLFDEADVLLQARDRTNMQRNAILSVFLRVLEYYSGILILTTNRVGTFDEAIKSRIHLVLYYPSLDKRSCMKLWEMSLTRVRDSRYKDGRKIKINMASIMDFLDDWLDNNERAEQTHKLPNGRDIGNAVQGALALADSQGEALSYQHLKAILRMSHEFDKYMATVHGGTDDVQARRLGDRNDDYWDKPKPARHSISKPLFTTSRQSDRLRTVLAED